MRSFRLTGSWPFKFYYRLLSKTLIIHSFLLFREAHATLMASQRSLRRCSIDRQFRPIGTMDPLLQDAEKPQADMDVWTINRSPALNGAWLCIYFCRASRVCMYYRNQPVQRNLVRHLIYFHPLRYTPRMSTGFTKLLLNLSAKGSI